MTAHLLRRAGAVTAGAALALSLGAAAPAAAATPGDTFTSRTVGGSGSVSWTEYDLDDRLGLPGNVHMGWLEVSRYGSYTYAWGSVDDWQCDEGEVPGGGHGEEPEEGFCELTGTRYLENETEDSITFQIARKTGAARVTGTLLVHGGHGGHGEPGEVLGRPPVSITWQPTSAGSRYGSFQSWWDEYGSYRSLVRGTRWDGKVRGAIGAMGFTDDADDEASGGTNAWVELSREVIRGR